MAECKCQQRLYGKAAEIYQSYSGRERAAMVNHAIIAYDELIKSGTWQEINKKLDMILENNMTNHCRSGYAISDQQSANNGIPKELGEL